MIRTKGLLISGVAILALAACAGSSRNLCAGLMNVEDQKASFYLSVEDISVLQSEIETETQGSGLQTDLVQQEGFPNADRTERYTHNTYIICDGASVLVARNNVERSRYLVQSYSAGDLGIGMAKAMAKLREFEIEPTEFES